MTDQGLLLLIKFISNNQLTIHELEQLRAWMASPENRTIDEWMQVMWNKAPNRESALRFEQLISEIDKQCHLQKSSILLNHRIVDLFQRVAAILIFPIIFLFAYYVISQKSDTVVYSEAIVPMGQKSEIVLPDSTHIWLNSGTRLRYPVEFGARNRDVFLTGEAYFEVAKNRHKPFIVHSSAVAVKVLGTKLNVKAYSDDQEIEIALLEGKVNLFASSKSGKVERLEMNPGELVDYSKTNKSLLKTDFRTEEIVGWKNNQLVFRDDTFDKLVKKIERWYNVKIIYDKYMFNDQRLTVKLKEGETLDRLFRIIEKSLNVNYRIDKQQIYISPK